MEPVSQQVEGLPGIVYFKLGHLCVAGCGIQAAMPKQDLQGAEIKPLLKQVGGKTMSQRMWGDPLINPTLFEDLL